ncbi:MAG: flagellar hook-basal body protein [Balneolaceae bacterium]
MIDRFEAHMQALQMLSKAQEVTADNLANINTPGFKGNTLFHRLLSERVNGVELTKSVPMQQVNMEQGVLEPTGNDLDVGIDGDGFFVVEEDGENYLTRDGRFQLNSDGYMVNSSGARVLGHGGAIHIPEYFQAAEDGQGEVDLSIGKDGTIRLNEEVYDQLRIVEVEDPSLLERRGSSYFSVENMSALAESNSSTVMQGYYEKGNVQPLHEMVDMMRNMQMFEAQQRAMKTTDETLAQATGTLGRF